MPKTAEELEAELTAVSGKLAAEAAERAKIEQKLTEQSGKYTEAEKARAELVKRLEAAEALRAEFEEIKKKLANTPPLGNQTPATGDEDIESLLGEEDKVAVDEAFNKLSDEHQAWVLADKKNRAEFMADIVGKGKTKPKSLFKQTKTSLSVRDQIRQALNLETSEDIPPGGPGGRTPPKKGGTKTEEEITTSVPNGDVLGALRQQKK